MLLDECYTNTKDHSVHRRPPDVPVEATGVLHPGVTMFRGSNHHMGPRASHLLRCDLHFGRVDFFSSAGADGNTDPSFAFFLLLAGLARAQQQHTTPATTCFCFSFFSSGLVRSVSVFDDSWEQGSLG